MSSKFQAHILAQTQDTKIYAKLLARCILQVLPTLINPDHVVFIKGRQTPDSTQRILNILFKLESLTESIGDLYLRLSLNLDFKGS